MAEVTIHWSDAVQPGDVTDLYAISSDTVSTVTQAGEVAQELLDNLDGATRTSSSAIVDIPTTAWTVSGDVWTASVTVAATSTSVLVAPATADSAAAWAAAQVWADSPVAGTVTLTAQTQPTAQISARVQWWSPVGAVETVTLTVAGWSGVSQDVTVAGLGSRASVIGPASLADQQRAAAAQLFVTQLEGGVIHATVATPPTSDINLTIQIL